MLGWVLIGIIALVIIFLIILKILNKKPDYQITRMSNSLEEKTSPFQRFLDACCRHKA